MSNKKEAERRILDCVYSDAYEISPDYSERPDFRLTTRDTSTGFGVEITELWSSESNARLDKIPGYINDVLYNGRYRHDADKLAFIKGHMDHQPPDGVRQLTPVIISEAGTVGDFTEALITRIDSKSAKYNEYDKSLDHISLIIADRDRGLRDLDQYNIYKHLYTDSLKATLGKTPFREVYLITTIPDSKQVYIRLRQILLNSYLSLWIKLQQTFERQLPALRVDRRAEAFASYLAAKFTEVRLYDIEGLKHVLCSGKAFCFDGITVDILDLHDSHLPLMMNAEIPHDTFYSSATFMNMERELLQENIYPVTNLPAANYDLRSTSGVMFLSSHDFPIKGLPGKA